MAITRTLRSPDGRSLVLDAERYAVQRSEIEGLPPIRAAERALPLDDGGVMEDLWAEPRTVTIVSRLLGASHDGLLARAGALNALLRLNGRRVRTEAWEYEESAVSGTAALLHCFPVGVVQETKQGFSREVGVQLRATDPFWYATEEESVDLAFAQTLTTRHIVARVDGEWTALGPPVSVTAVGGSARPEGIVKLSDGKILVFGIFANWDNQAALDYIAYWDPETEAWGTLGTPSVASGYVEGATVGPDGTLHIVGTFTDFAGVAAADHYAYWTGSAWAARGTGPGSTARGVAVDPATGDIYVGGDFGVSYWTGAAWSAVGTCPVTAVFAVLFGPDGTLYAAGSDGSGARLASWDGSTWTTLATSATGYFYSMAITNSGQVYVAGSYGATVDGESLGRGIVAWNGYAMEGLDGGLEHAGGAAVYEVAVYEDRVYVVGTFDEAGSLDIVAGVAWWNGFTWNPVGAEILDSIPAAIISTIFADRDSGDLYIGYDGTGDLTTAAATTVSNAGSADVHPVFTVTGPGTLQSIANVRSGQEILFDLWVNEGETVTIDTRPGRRSVVSDWRGRLEALPGGDDAGFVLWPGENLITAYMTDTDTSTSLACAFTPRSWTFEEAVRDLVHGVARADTAAVFGPTWGVFARGGTWYARSRVDPNDVEATVAGGWREEEAGGLTLIGAGTNLFFDPVAGKGDLTYWASSSSSVVTYQSAGGLFEDTCLKTVRGGTDSYAQVVPRIIDISALGAEEVTFSAYLQNIDVPTGSGTLIRLMFRWEGGANPDANEPGGFVNYGVIPEPGAWQRYSHTATIDYADRTDCRVYIQMYNTAITDGQGFLIDGVQVTEGAAAVPFFYGGTEGAVWYGRVHASTSTIATGGTCSLSNPLSVNAGAVGMWWRPAADESGGTRYLFSEGNIEAYFDAVTGDLLLAAGVNRVAIEDLIFAADTEQFLVFVWAASRMEIYIDGESAASGTSYTASNAGATLYIGTDSAGANPCNGTLRQVFATTRALTDAEVLAIYNEGSVA